MKRTESVPAAGDSSPRPVTPVGVLAERLAGVVKELITRPDIGAALRSELVDLAALAGGLEPYVEEHTSDESDALSDIAVRTQQLDWSSPRSSGVDLEREMLSGHVEGQLLQMLTAATSAARVLEIGLFTGYSALAMAEVMPPDGILIACELDAEVAQLAQRAFDAAPVGSLIDVRVGPALTTLEELAREQQQFDLVFLDADKRGYTEYVDAVLTHRLLAPRGLLCIDNTLMQGQPWTGSATDNGRSITFFNRWLRADPRVVQVLVPIRDGLTLVRWADPRPS